MRRKTSGNTCARPISPTACSKTTPQSSTLASSHGVAFSTSSVASSPSPAVIVLLPVNHSEVWYKTKFPNRGWFGKMEASSANNLLKNETGRSHDLLSYSNSALAARARYKTLQPLQQD